MPALRVVPVVAFLAINGWATAQTRSVHDTASAYGARLNAKGEPEKLNSTRVDMRLNSRLETRLSLRIERYRPNNAANPVAAFAARGTDRARVGTDTTLSALSSSGSPSGSQDRAATPAQRSRDQGSEAVRSR